MDAKKLLMTIYERNITLQQLVALVTKTFALNHDVLINQKINDPNKAFAVVLSNFSKNDKDFLKKIQYKMTHKKLFENGKTNKPLLKEIDVKRLDHSFLLNLLIRTNFLNISTKQGKCNRNHPSCCCSNCNHSNTNGQCNNCKKSKRECEERSLICCNECNLCISCCKDEYERFYNDAMAKKVEPNAYQNCVMYIFKNCLLTDALNFRNLFHLTRDDCKDLNNKPLEKFPNQKSEEELLLYIEIVMNSMIRLIEICFKNKSQYCDLNIVKSNLKAGRDFEETALSMTENMIEFDYDVVEYDDYANIGSSQSTQSGGYGRSSARYISKLIKERFDFNKNQRNEITRQVLHGKKIY